MLRISDSALSKAVLSLRSNFHPLLPTSATVLLPTTPYYLITIGEGAFENCYYLERINIPSDVTTIEKSAFSHCSQLTAVLGMYSVNSIGEGAFENCYRLMAFNFPTQITKISAYTFSSCSDLTSITIPSNVTSIGEGAFDSCLKLEKVTIPKSVTSISANAFDDCRSLTAVYCSADPDNLTWGVSSKDFIVNKGTTCYVASRFLDKYQSKFSGINVNFEANVIDSGSCGDGVTYLIDGDGAMVISKTGTGTGAMTNFTNEYDVPWNSHRQDITSLTINDGVTSIGDWSFYFCKELTNVSLADSITSIGKRAFGETSKLKSIELPANLESIGDYAFCVSLIESVTIPDSVITIGNGAFLSAYKMTSITIGDHVQTIGEEAFSSSAIESVTVPASVTSIGKEAFNDCSYLKSLTLSEGLTSIGEDAFMYCYNLQSVNIPEGVTTIEEDAFYGCYALESITIPCSVQNMGVGVFRECTSLTSVTIANGVTSIPHYDRPYNALCRPYGRHNPEDNRGDQGQARRTRQEDRQRLSCHHIVARLKFFGKRDRGSVGDHYHARGFFRVLRSNIHGAVVARRIA